MKEIYKDIKGYEGLYQISNLGNVRALDRTTAFGRGYKKIPMHNLTICIDSQGYNSVCLSKDGVQKRHLVHRLVAYAFLNNPNGYPEVNHKDENKSNNCVSNLEFCTSKYNANYGNRNKKVVDTKKTKGLLKKVVCVETGVVYDTISDAARSINGWRSNIWKCIKDGSGTSGGYHWKYAS